MLAFLWALCWPHWAHAQLSVWGQAQQHAGRGLLSPQHWPRQNLNTPSDTTWNYAFTQAGVGYSHGDWSGAAYHSREWYYTGNQHVLSLLSEYETQRAINTQALNDLSAQGQLYRLESSHLSIRKRWSWPETGFIELQPHIFQIHHYEHTQLNLTLKQSASLQKNLNGSVQKVGTKVYGFDLNNRPDAGTGWGLNVQAALSNPWGTTSLSAKNLAGQLNFSNVHFSNRNSELVTFSDQLTPQETPAMFGRYGQFAKKEKLPTFWQIHQSWDKVPGLSTGWLSLNNHSSFQASYTHRLNSGHIQVTQTGIYQTQISGLWQPTPVLGFTMGLGFYKGKYPQWSLLSAQLQF